MRQLNKKVMMMIIIYFLMDVMYGNGNNSRIIDVIYKDDKRYALSL